LRPPPSSTLFPYTTLFRSLTGRVASADSLARAMDSLAAAPPQPLTPGPQSLVFIVWDNPPIVIGAGSYLDRLASLAGARNVFHEDRKSTRLNSSHDQISYA